MERELKTFREAKDKLYDYCILNITSITLQSLSKKSKKKNFKVDPRSNTTIDQYILTEQGQKSNQCKYMTMNEHGFSSFIWKLQNP